MTLYRIDEELAEMLARDEGPSLGAIIRRGIQVGVLVPVPPCIHGRYDGHWGPRYTGPNYDSDIQVRNWCPGAAVGEDT